jgi:hypothetical protein
MRRRRGRQVVQDGGPARRSDRVLLRTKEAEGAALDAAELGTLRPRWDGPGPFKVIVPACPSPNAYNLALPRKMPMLCSQTIRLYEYYRITKDNLGYVRLYLWGKLPDVSVDRPNLKPLESSSCAL